MEEIAKRIIEKTKNIDCKHFIVVLNTKDLLNFLRDADIKIQYAGKEEHDKNDECYWGIYLIRTEDRSIKIHILEQLDSHGDTTRQLLSSDKGATYCYFEL